MPRVSARPKKNADVTKAFTVAAARSERFILRLFVAGSTPRSTLALANLKEVCEEHLAGRYDLEVIDVYQQPARARDEQILAVPTLLKLSPAPVRKLIGDLSTRDDVLLGLGIRVGKRS